MPSLANTLPRRYWTVRALMNSRAAISGLDSPPPGQPRHLGLLDRQRLRGSGSGSGDTLRGAPGHGLTGGQQLAPGPLGKPFHPHLVQHPVGEAQLLQRVVAALLPA
jgi:hypothetical protein